MSRIPRLGLALILAVIIMLLVLAIPAIAGAVAWIAGLASLTIVIWAFLTLIGHPTGPPRQ